MSLDFYRQNMRWLGVLGLMNFASGFGQTFFIALFAGEIRQEFALSHGEWGTFYAIGTLLSAALMLGTGGLVDRVQARKFALMILFLLALSCLGMALLHGVWLLPVVIFALRFCGQGMLSHLPLVLVGRWFRENRGKSVASAMLGFTLAEATLPIIFVAIMLTSGWRTSWLVASISALGLMVVIYALLGKERTAQGTTTQQDGAGMYGRHWTRREMLRHWVFWFALAAFLAHPFLGTVFFFQMVELTEIKGWALENFVALMPLYTLSSLLAMFVFGNLVDRLGVSKIMGVYLLPLVLAFCILSAGESLYVAALALVGVGVSQGAGATVVGAFWPEYYGIRHLGSIRAVATSVMVFASALGPLISGWMLDVGMGFSTQLLMMAAIGILASVLFCTVSVGTMGARLGKILRKSEIK